jgi:hypothetical protein
MQMQIHLDSGGSPGAIVSDQYVSQLAGMGNGTATPTFLFTNGTALAANTNYWIVLTSEASANIKWHSTVTQNTTQSIELSAGLAVAANAAELIPPDQVPTTCGMLTQRPTWSCLSPSMAAWWVRSRHPRHRLRLLQCQVNRPQSPPPLSQPRRRRFLLP